MCEKLNSSTVMCAAEKMERKCSVDGKYYLSGVIFFIHVAKKSFRSKNMRVRNDRWIVRKKILY